MFAARYFPVRHFAPRYWPKTGAAAEGGGTGTIAYNPAAIAAYYAQPPKTTKPVPKFIAPDEWAVDYKIPAQTIRLIGHPGRIVAEVCPWVRVRVTSGGKIIIRATGKALAREVEKHYLGACAGLADVAGLRKQIHRQRARDEEARLMAVFRKSGFTVEDAVGAMVEG
jgi:hypothetical protein